MLLAVLVAVPQWSPAALAPELPDPGNVKGITKEQQEQVGLKAMAEVYKQMPVLPDSSPVAQYIQRLGTRLEKAIPPQYSWPYQFHVVPEKEINAFALPGGPIFVNAGTINAAANEAELAGVMAHEMAHVYMQHSMKAAKQRSTPSAVLGVLGGVLGSMGGLGSLASLGVQIGAGAVFMKYSRQDEAQADAVGVIVMYKAGYNPQAMADFFRKLEQPSAGSGGPQFLSDHPNPGNRQEAIQKEIADWPPQNWRPDSSQFEEAKSDAKDLRVYSAQEIAQGAKSGLWQKQNSRAGATSASLPTAGEAVSDSGDGFRRPVEASVTLAELQHEGYRIKYPDNWKAYGDAQSPVTIAPPGGVSQQAVAYGVLINRYQPRSSDPEQALDELIAQLKQQNPDLRAVGSPQPITVNGAKGESLELLGTSPVQRNGSAQRERDWLVALSRPGGGLQYLIFVAPEPDFSVLRPTFETMLRTFHLES
jgi:hypothetical protein